MYVCVCHSLTADSVTTHPVFLTHLYQNCNLAHWTFKLLDVTSKGIGEEKHYLLLITSPTSVKPVFASLPPFYSTCYFLPVIFFSLFFFFFLNWCALSFNSFIGMYFFVQYCQSKMSVFPHWQACLYTVYEMIYNLIWNHALIVCITTRKQLQKFKCQWRYSNNLEFVLLVLFLHSVFMLHYISVCFMSPLSCFTPCCLSLPVPLSLSVLFPLSLPESLALFSGYRIIGLRVRVGVRWTMRQRLASKVPAQHSS